MKLHTIIEMYIKYDNMHTNRIINPFVCINNYVNLCIKCMLSVGLPLSPLINMDLFQKIGKT